MADRDHGVAAALDRGAQRLERRRPARGPRRRRPRAPPPRRSPSAVSRARRSGLETTASGSRSASRSPSRRAASRPDAVSGRSSSGSARRGLGVADEDHAHHAQAYRVEADAHRSATSSPTSSPTRRCSGNQLAVFTDARDLDPLTMQALAKEMAFSETVFVLPPQAEDADVRIRIFTPATELPFAGHPTLGTAFVLGGPLQKIVLRLETGAGVVPVELEREGAEIRFGWMDQPIPTWEPFDARGRAARRARRRALGAAGRALPPRPEPRLRRARLARAGRRARAGLRGARRGSPTPGVNCFARDGAGWKTRMFAPGARRPRGSGDRLGGRPARDPPRAPRPDRLRRGDRDLAGRRARPALDALRERRGRRRPDRAGARRRLGGDRRARRVQDSLSATASISGSSTGERRPEDARRSRET